MWKNRAWYEQKNTTCKHLLYASVTLINANKSRLMWTEKHRLLVLFGCLSHYYKCKKIAPGMSRKTSPANFLLHISVTILMQKHHAKCEEKHRLRAFVGCFSHYYKCKRIVPGMSRKAPPANFCCTPQSLLLMLTNHAWCEQKSTACVLLLDASVTSLNIKITHLVWAEKHRLQTLLYASVTLINANKSRLMWAEKHRLPQSYHSIINSLLVPCWSGNASVW